MGVPITMGIVGIIKHDDNILKNAYLIASASVINFGRTSFRSWPPTTKPAP